MFFISILYYIIYIYILYIIYIDIYIGQGVIYIFIGQPRGLADWPKGSNSRDIPKSTHQCAGFNGPCMTAQPIQNPFDQPINQIPQQKTLYFASIKGCRSRKQFSPNKKHTKGNRSYAIIHLFRRSLFSKGIDSFSQPLGHHPPIEGFAHQQHITVLLV